MTVWSRWIPPGNFDKSPVPDNLQQVCHKGKVCLFFKSRCILVTVIFSTMWCLEPRWTKQRDAHYFKKVIIYSENLVQENFNYVNLNFPHLWTGLFPCFILLLLLLLVVSSSSLCTTKVERPIPGLALCL